MPLIEVIRNWNPHILSRVSAFGFVDSAPSLYTAMYQNPPNYDLDNIEGYNNTGATYTTQSTGFRAQYGDQDRCHYQTWPEQIVCMSAWNESLSYQPFTDTEYIGQSVYKTAGVEHYHWSSDLSDVHLWQNGTSWLDVTAWTCWDGFTAGCNIECVWPNREGLFFYVTNGAAAPAEVYSWSGDSAVSAAKIFESAENNNPFWLFSTDDDVFLIARLGYTATGELWRLDWTGASFNLLSTDCSYTIWNANWGDTIVRKDSGGDYWVLMQAVADSTTKLGKFRPDGSHNYFELITSVSSAYAGWNLAVDPVSEDLYILNHGYSTGEYPVIYKYDAPSSGLSAIPAAYFKSLCDLLFARGS